MTISAVLSGCENDPTVLQSVLLMAARDGYDVKIVLAETFPKRGFLRMFDVANSRLLGSGLSAPNVAVERHRQPRSTSMPA